MESCNIPNEDRDREEEALVQGLTIGDSDQVRAFLRRTHRPLYAMAARLTSDPDLRHDWCQDILLKIIQEMEGGRFVYQRPGCFWAWFQMRANFLLINSYQRQKKQNERWTTGEVGAALVEKMPGFKNGDPLKILEDLEARRVIEECIEQLESENHRVALHLVLFQERSYHEIAEAMGASLNTVRSWIRRARVAMRRCVARKFNDTAGKES